jgi:hypothetical protein
MMLIGIESMKDDKYSSVYYARILRCKISIPEDPLEAAVESRGTQER